MCFNQKLNLISVNYHADISRTTMLIVSLSPPHADTHYCFINEEF